MSIAFTEMRRAKLKFGLLTGAVALLVFLASIHRWAMLVILVPRS